MPTKHIFATLMLTLVLTSAQAALQAENAIESQSGFIQLPETPVGKMSASSCSGCRSRSLEITPTSSYIVNGREVTYQQLRRVLAGSRTLSVVVAYYSDSQQLSRIIVGEIR